jgi:hypothetical protein
MGENSYWLLVTGYWLLVAGCWLLVAQQATSNKQHFIEKTKFRF